MRKIAVKAKNEPKEIACLLFFTQVLDELVFDHSDDSYKAPALNTYSRTLELRRLAQLNDEASIGSAALEAFIDELEWSIKGDETLSRNQRSICTHHIKVIRTNLGTPDRLDRSISAITLSLGNYFENCCETLRDTILQEPNKKKKIASTAASFVAQLELEGFSRRYCYHIKQKLVRKLQSEIILDIKATTENFFKAFTTPIQNYKVILTTSKNIEKFVEVSEYFFCKILEISECKLDEKQYAVREIYKLHNANKLCVVFDEIRAREPIEARDRAVSIFNLFVASIGFQYHDLKIDLEPLALVKDEGRLHVTVGTSPDPMHRNRRNPTEINKNEVKEFAEVLFGVHLTPVSTRRFINAVEFHRSALRSSIEHNQLVDLWAAIEGLLPAPGKDSPRIRFFVANLVAPLCLTYAEKLFQQVLDEICISEPDLAKTISEIPSGSSLLHKLVALVVTKDHLDIQENISTNLIHSNPLLLYRIWELSERFKSAKATRETLLSHRKKVTWHIERIYSTRNSIMHNAEALPYLGTLVENLHGYVDTLLSSIARIAKNSAATISINTALEHILAHEVERFSELDSMSKDSESNDCSTQTFEKIVFGSSNPLKPT